MVSTVPRVSQALSPMLTPSSPRTSGGKFADGTKKTESQCTSTTGRTGPSMSKVSQFYMVTILGMFLN